MKVVNQLTHVSQVMTGFAMLARKGRINLEFEFVPAGTADQPSHIVLATLGTGVRIAYDLGDGGGIDRRTLDQVDVYFKRSFRRVEPDDRVLPFGLNYTVSWAHDPLENYRRVPTLDQLEGAPRRNERPLVLFVTRLWDPRGEHHERGQPGFDDDVASERRALNEMRVGCVRALRKRFPENFVGGLQPSEFTYAHHADLVLDRAATIQDSYLRTMHECDIGVSTRGVHLSNPWKLGEYLSASKAVVTERLASEVPSLVVGQNYLMFDTAEECVARVEDLVVDPRLVHEMQVRNQRFYRDHLRPDRVVARTLSQSLALGAR